MKLYHLTPKELYDEHIKHEGLVPQPIDPGYAPGDVPENAIFCWPVYTKQLIKDWILFSKVKTENKYGCNRTISCFWGKIFCFLGM